MANKFIIAKFLFILFLIFISCSRDKDCNPEFFKKRIDLELNYFYQPIFKISPIYFKNKCGFKYINYQFFGGLNFDTLGPFKKGFIYMDSSKSIRAAISLMDSSVLELPFLNFNLRIGDSINIKYNHPSNSFNNLKSKIRIMDIFYDKEYKDTIYNFRFENFWIMNEWKYLNIYAGYDAGLTSLNISFIETDNIEYIIKSVGKDYSKFGSIIIFL